MKLEHSHTVPHKFDANNVTESDIRTITRAHYDYLQWMEDKAKGIGAIENSYSPDGITVWFELEEDHLAFLKYIVDSDFALIYD